MGREQTPLSDEETLPGAGTRHADPDTVPSAPATELAELAPGTRIGRYVLLERLGAGGMGVVYGAYDPHLDRRIALKLLRRESDASDASRRLLREAQAMARLRHPNVVTVHDVDIEDDRVFIAMEFIEGQTLRRWRNEERPDWPRLLDAYVQAGRGLAAAHAADLVHRDFKPDNAMVDANGRVAVMDFGIARASAALDTEDLPPTPNDAVAQAGSTGSLDSGALGDDLTMTGALLGTPGYMSPEQFGGSPTDHRSDQFSFCVALYEALYGARPFAGDTPAALAFNVLGGKLEDPRGRTEVPSRLFTVMRRGLATQPEDRYSSMDALLAELVRDPAARWRKARIPAAAIAAGLGAALWFASRSPEATLCTGSEQMLANVYDEARRGEIRSAFVATQAPFAEQIVETALARLDDYARRWVEVRVDACEATRVRGEQSDLLLDRRMLCLEERLDELASVTSVLAEADAQVAQHGLDALEGLGPLELCSDVEWLTARVAPPTDPAIRERVGELHASLARVTALRLAGKTSDGLALAREVFDATEALDHPPTRATAAARLAMLERSDRTEAKAVEHFSLALQAAVLGGDDRLATEAALGMAGALMEAPEHRAEGGRWIALAEGFWRRHPEDVRIRAKIANARASFLRDGGKAGEALAVLQEARELLRRDQAATEHEHSVLLDGMGHAQQLLGRYRDAAATYEEVLEIDLRTVGEAHPDTAMAHNNLGAMQTLLGNHEQALVHHRKSLSIREGVYGRDHPALGSTLYNLATTLSALGLHDEAEQYGLRNLELTRKHSEGNALRVAQAAGGLGALLYNAGQPERALPHYREALAVHERMDPDHTTTHVARYNLGEALEALGQLDEAMQLHVTARDRLAEILGADHPYVTFPMAGVGRVQLARGEFRAAARTLEQVVEVLDSPESDPAESARARFDLGRALAAGGDLTRGLALAGEARTMLENASGDHSHRLAQIDAWLRDPTKRDPSG